MSKCYINENNEIIEFWKDINSSTPSDAIDCVTIEDYNPIQIKSGSSDNITYFYTLVDGVVTPTSAGTSHEAQIYVRKRQIDYPSEGDQFDMIYKDMKNSTTTHADAVEAVKTKWPKDNTGPVE